MIRALKKNNTTQITTGKRIDNIQYLTLMLPGLICMILFCYLPMVGVIMAFKQYNPNLGIFGSNWNGLDNFMFFFKSDSFFRLMRNTVGYGALFLVLDNLFAILLAVLYYNVRSKGMLKYFQTSAILPSFMSIILISYIVYAILDPVNGIANSIFSLFGSNGVSWYSEPKYWPFILTVTHIWSSVGMGCLIYYATMVGIDKSLFEAATIDGASKFQQTLHIIIPELGTLICMKLILGVGRLMGGDFGLFYQVPRDVGVLYSATDIFPTYTFRALKEGAAYGRTAAVGLFQSVAGTILVLGSNFVIKKISPENSLF